MLEEAWLEAEDRVPLTVSYLRVSLSLRILRLIRTVRDRPIPQPHLIRAVADVSRQSHTWKITPAL